MMSQVIRSHSLSGSRGDQGALGCGGGGGTLVYGIGRIARSARLISASNGASRAPETRRSPPAARQGRFWRRAGIVFVARLARKQFPAPAEAESARSARPLPRTALPRTEFACGRHEIGALIR